MSLGTSGKSIIQLLERLASVKSKRPPRRGDDRVDVVLSLVCATNKCIVGNRSTQRKGPTRTSPLALNKEKRLTASGYLRGHTGEESEDLYLRRRYGHLIVKKKGREMQTDRESVSIRRVRRAGSSGIGQWNSRSRTSEVEGGTGFQSNGSFLRLQCAKTPADVSLWRA